MPQNQLMPFRMDTRQKIAKVGQVPFSTAGLQSIRLPSTGFLASIYLRFSGSISNSAAITAGNVGQYAPYSILKNISLNINSGQQQLVNCSGWSLFLLSRQRYSRKIPFSFNTAANAKANYSFPSDSGTNPFNFTLEIPVSVSDGQNFSLGLINLQAPELECVLELTFASSLAAISSVTTGLTGVVEVFYKYYEVPNPTTTELPPPVLHKILENSYSVNSTGLQTIEIPRGGRVMRLANNLQLNGVRSAAWTNVGVQLNKTYTVYDKPQWLVGYEENVYAADASATDANPQGLIVGEIPVNLMRAWAMNEESDIRDTLNTERATTTDLLVTVADNATLGSNNNFITVAREILQIPVM
jgi:hypothetical protein